MNMISSTGPSKEVTSPHQCVQQVPEHTPEYASPTPAGEKKNKDVKGQDNTTV